MSRVVLTAANGMVFTDGNSGGRVVYLAEGQTAEGWYEVSEEEFDEAVQSGVPIGHISDSEALNIILGGDTA